MGGGSSDAAATLIAMAEICNKPIMLDRLIAIASRLGADVPFCLVGGTAVGEGTGEKLTRIPIEEELYFVIAKPAGISISTAWAYETFDRLAKTSSQAQGKTKSAAQLLTADRKWAPVYEFFGNDFEPMIFDHYPLLNKVKDFFVGNGVKACHLTGKGPALYAIVGGAEEAKELATSFLDHFDKSPLHHRGEVVRFECWTAKSHTRGVEEIDENEN